MKKISLFLLFFMLTGVIIFYSSCKKSESKSDNSLHVIVHRAAGEYIGGAQVKIYLSSHDRDVDSAAFIGVTDSTKPSLKGATFNGLATNRYYFKAWFMVGGTYYEGTGDTTVTVNKGLTYDIGVVKVLPNGDLKVYAQYNTVIFSGADVKLFKSDSDRTAGNVFEEATTMDYGVSAGGVFAYFTDVPFTGSKYYILATYHNSGTGTDYLGAEPDSTGIWVPKGTTTSIHVMMVVH